MENEDSIDLFFHLLDDSQLVAHINNICHASQKEKAHAGRIPSVLSSFGSDPFNDDLDSVLMKLNNSVPKQRSQNSFHSASTLSFEICANQLAAVVTDDDADSDRGEVGAEGNKGDEKSGAQFAQDAASDIEFEVGNLQEGPISNVMRSSFTFGTQTDQNRQLTNSNELRQASGLSISTDVLVDPINPIPDVVSKELLDSDDEADVSNFGHVGDQHKFGDFETYFDNKHRKQQLADQYFVQWEKRRRRANGESSQIPTIFANCTIFVNGNTVPSLPVIHKLVILHGGVFLQYLNNKSAATHIVCDKLTPRKRIEFRNYKVVRAAWIADSVEKQVLQDWRNYRLIDDVDYDQKRLGFEKVKSTIDDTSVPATSPTPESLSVNALENLIDDNDILDSEILDDDELLLDLGAEESTKLDGDLEGIRVNPVVDDFREIADDPSKTASGTTLDEQTEPKFSQFQIARPRNAFGQMDAKHPDFLAHFFANSRLHHLSTWKADLRSKFIRLVANHPDFLAKKADVPHVVLHIDFDCFFAAVSALLHPNLDINRDPIAVSHGGKSSDVASCNYVARLKGIRNGLWLGNAMQLCPDLKVIDYDFNAYEKASHAFYTYLISSNFFDSIFPVLIDEVLVDASTHCSKPEVNVDSFCKQIRDDVLKLSGCTISIGASKNILLAKLATRQAKPNGQFYLHKDIESFLDGTNLRDMPGMGYGLCRKLCDETDLNDSSMIFVRDVKHFSLQKLMRILGEATGQKLFNYCRGIDQTLIKLDTSSSEALLGRKSVSVEVNFGIRFDTFNQVETFLVNVAKELQTRMINIGVCGSRLLLKLARRQPNSPVNPPKYMGMGKVDFFSRTSSMGIPTNDWGLVGSELKALCRSLNIPPEELRGVGVTMAKLVDIEVAKKTHQQKLQFSKNTRLKPVSAVQSSQMFPYAERVVNSESIDWEVFNQLPDAIRLEFKKELLRRGIPVSSKEKSPTKQPGQKVFMQQLFPSQPFGSYKSVRVLESPTKKKRKIRESPTKVQNVIFKEESPTPYNDETMVYDEDVLNEIPSSIRNEFIAECEKQQRNKKLAFVSIREKLELKDQQRKHMEENTIDEEWLKSQPRLVRQPTMPGLASEYSQLVVQLGEWIHLSLAEGGPHPDDVSLFVEYLRELAVGGIFNRAITLVKFLTLRIEMESTKAKLCYTDRHQLAVQHGLGEWISVVNEAQNILVQLGQDKGIEIDFDP